MGLIPLLFVFSLSAGLVAFILGLIAWYRRRHWEYKDYRKLKSGMATAGTILGALAMVLGIIGIVIVTTAFDDLDKDLQCIDDAHTAEEIDACN